MNQVYGCPSCQQPFQVAAEQAGQVVQCPACAQTVEIPASAFESPTPIQTPPSQQHFACPGCQGKFGITADMFGQQVGCPHCKMVVLIQDSSPTPELELPPKIKTAKGSSKRKPVSRSKEKLSSKQKLAAKKKTKSGNSSKRWKDASDPGKVDPSLPATDGKSAQSSKQLEPGKSGAKQNPAKPTETIEPQRRNKTSADSTPSKQKSDSTVKKSQTDPNPPKTKSSSKKSRLQSPTRPTPEVPTPEVPIVVDAEEVVLETDESPKLKSDNKSEAVKPVVNPERISEAQVAESEIVESEIVDATVGPIAETQAKWPLPIDHLLPPLFDVFDPTRIRGTKGQQFKVTLPDGEGGTTQVDQRVVRVEHDGEQISLVVLSPQEKKRRRTIQNVIAIIIGIGVLTAAFFLLR